MLLLHFMLMIFIILNFHFLLLIHVPKYILNIYTLVLSNYLTISTFLFFSSSDINDYKYNTSSLHGYSISSFDTTPNLTIGYYYYGQQFYVPHYYY